MRPASTPAKPSRQEERVLALAMDGLTDKEIAVSLGVALDTVRTYWERIRRKRGGGTRAEIIASLLREDARVELETHTSETRLLAEEVARRREAERRFRAMADASPLGILVTDRARSCTYVNDAWQVITGRSADSALGSGWLDLVDPRDRSDVEAPWAAGGQDQRVFDREFRCLRPDGQTVYVRLRVAPMMVAEDIGGFVGTLEDVTERRRTLEALASSEAKHRALTECAPQFIWRTDPAGKLVDINAHASDYTGRSEAFLKEHGFSEVIHPDDIYRAREVWTTSIANRSGFSCDLRVRRFDGTYRWHLSRAVPLLGANQEVLAWFGSTIDVHDAREANEELWQLRDMLESATDLFVCFHPDGLGIYANQTARRRLRLSPSKQSVWYLQKVLAASAYEILLKEAIPSAVDVGYWTGELSLIEDPGSVPVSLSVQAHRSPRGEVAYFSLIARDLTERKALEQAVRKERDLLDAVFDSTESLICVLDQDARFVRLNDACCRLTGRTEEELSGLRAIETVVPLKQYNDVSMFMPEGVFKDVPRLAEVEWSNMEGQRRLIQWRNAPIFGPDGSLRYVVVTGHDVTDERATAKRLIESQTRFRTVAEATHDGLVLHDSTGFIVYANPAAERILGLTNDQILGITSMDPQWRTVRPDGQPFPGSEHPAMIALRTGEPQIDVLMGVLKPSGDHSWIVTTAQPIFEGEDGKPTAVVASFSDVTERRMINGRVQAQLIELEESRRKLESQTHELEQANARLITLAHDDMLTGLLNRRAFEDALAAAGADARAKGVPITLMLLNVDKLSEYNEDLGRSAGDEALRAIGYVLKNTARSGDRIARIDGDEFAIIASGVEFEADLVHAEAVREAVATFDMPYGPVRLSIGVSRWIEGDTDLSFFERAGRALFRSKKAGGNIVTVDPAILDLI